MREVSADPGQMFSIIIHDPPGFGRSSWFAC